MLEPDRLVVGLLRTAPRRRLPRRTLAVAAVAAAVALAAIGFARRPAGEAQVGPASLLTLDAPDLQLEPEPALAPLVEGSGWGTFSGSPASVEGAIEPGQTLTAALVARGVQAAAVQPAVAALASHFDFRRSQPGHQFRAELDGDGSVVVLRYQTAPETVYEARRQADGAWDAGLLEVDLEVREKVLGGVIESSLIASFIAAGERESLATTFANIFQWDIDFSRQVRAGDAWRVVYEAVHLDGEFLRYGRILAAEYRGARTQISAFYFDEEGVDPDFFTTEGQPLERMFLAAPCRYRRISSPFNPNRLHPVLGVRRPHLGVDYAAPTGTPVYSVADGTVVWVGPRGGNGNLVRIRHAHGYESGYAHLSRFARGLRQGDRVTQGQVIGFVGSTGLSTGPHLHFGLKRNGTYVDPLGESNARAPQLTGRALRAFERRRAQFEARLGEHALPEVALDATGETFVVEDMDGFHGGSFEESQ